MVLDAIRGVLESMEPRRVKAERVADLIRRTRGYRWVGLYDVDRDKITIIGWSGPGAPAYLRFPASKGLSGSAVRTRTTVVVNDVTADPRYLTAFGSTRSEMIVPVLDPATGSAIGTIDVESEHVNAFKDEDRALVEQCALVSAPLFIGRVVG